MILFRLFSPGLPKRNPGLEFANAFSVKGRTLYSREFVLAHNSTNRFARASTVCFTAV